MDFHESPSCPSFLRNFSSRCLWTLTLGPPLLLLSLIFYFIFDLSAMAISRHSGTCPSSTHPFLDTPRVPSLSPSSPLSFFSLNFGIYVHLGHFPLEHESARTCPSPSPLPPLPSLTLFFFLNFSNYVLLGHSPLGTSKLRNMTLPS